jgi:dTDP-4-dehydrorhamnose 3,5-epimerase
VPIQSLLLSAGDRRRMNVSRARLDGLFIIEPECFPDERGYFLETYRNDRYAESGIADRFVQDNLSRSRQGILRGLHFRVRRPQAQLVTVVRGRIFDVCVDLRTGSPTFSQWFGIELSDDRPRQLFMAPGFAHGFCVLSEWADVHYKVTERYDPGDVAGLRWNDPDVGIRWPIATPLLAPRDAAYPLLRELTASHLPHLRTLA